MKKLFALLAVVGMSVAAIGCGAEDAKKDTTPPADSGAGADAGADAGTPAPADAGNPES